MSGSPLVQRTRAAGLSIGKLGDLLGIHPHLLHAFDSNTGLYGHTALDTDALIVPTALAHSTVPLTRDDLATSRPRATLTPVERMPVANLWQLRQHGG